MGGIRGMNVTRDHTAKLTEAGEIITRLGMAALDDGQPVAAEKFLILATGIDRVVDALERFIIQDEKEEV
jgi:hypothetical protein